jgi:hypothetical protein
MTIRDEKLKDEILIYGAKTLCYVVGCPEEAKYSKSKIMIEKEDMMHVRMEYFCEHHAPVGSGILDRKRERHI